MSYVFVRFPGDPRVYRVDREQLPPMSPLGATWVRATAPLGTSFGPGARESLLVNLSQAYAISGFVGKEPLDETQTFGCEQPDKRCRFPVDCRRHGSCAAKPTEAA